MTSQKQVSIDVVVGTLLRECHRHLRANQRSDARVVFISIVRLAVIYSPSNEVIRSIVDFTEIVPECGPDLSLIMERASPKALAMCASYQRSNEMATSAIAHIKAK